MVTGQNMAMSVEPVNDAHSFVVEVDLFNVCRYELSSLHHLSNGIDDRGDLQIAGSDLVEHRSKEDEVITAYQPYFGFFRRDKLLKLASNLNTSKSTAQDQYCCLLLHRRPPCGLTCVRRERTPGPASTASCRGGCDV
jgi:hypothetical protein